MRAASRVVWLVAATACASGPAPLEERWHADACPPGTQVHFQEKYWSDFATWPAQWCARPDGTKHGSWSEWYPDGHVRVSGQFVDGERVGVWIIYQKRPGWWERRREGKYQRIEFDYDAGETP